MPKAIYELGSKQNRGICVCQQTCQQNCQHLQRATNSVLNEPKRKPQNQNRFLEEPRYIPLLQTCHHLSAPARPDLRGYELGSDGNRGKTKRCFRVCSHGCRLLLSAFPPRRLLLSGVVVCASALRLPLLPSVFASALVVSKTLLPRLLPRLSSPPLGVSTSSSSPFRCGRVCLCFASASASICVCLVVSSFPVPDSLVEQSSQGQFTQEGRQDILATTIGRPEHPRRVRDAGTGIGIRQFFGSSSRPYSYEKMKEEIRKEMTQEIIKKVRAELYDEVAEMVARQFQQHYQDYGNRPPPSPVAEHVVPPTGKLFA
ncbi:hypothetical protein LR48_Vigan08g045800 [Vigna angularis]|uniref:Uncharacterized protein n=1 Tax=Phaseolus angularis TaxID=3914 RepID=A0A0L9V3S9_PHAAN|nr:hypothetical protein LR48_Vigan08g045800 [Vigna angularis]